MKKMIALIAVLFLFVLIGCQKTPEKPVIVDKNNESMINAAEEPQVSQEFESIREKVDAPEDIQFESTKDNLTIEVNAKVKIPDVDSIPIINVRSTVFSQDYVNKIWDTLIGDTPMWEWSDQPTKSDIEQMIINQKKLLSELENGSDSQEAKNFNKRITELEKLYQTAPDSVDLVSATSQLKEKVNWDPVLGTVDSRYMGTSGYSVKNEAGLMTEKWKYFCVHNPSTDMEDSIPSDQLPAKIIFETSTLSNNYFSGEIVDTETELDDSIKSILKTTPKEAKAVVEDFLNAIGVPMEVCSISLINDENKTEGKEAQNYAYEITCDRKVKQGLYVAAPLINAFGMGFEGYTPKMQEPFYSINWDYERMTLKMNDEGFFEISWSSPIEILDTEVEDSNMLSFNDIEKIFEKNMSVSYEPNIQKDYHMTCDISQIRLEMMRIRKQNTDQSSFEGLLIPVWNYYGKLTMKNSKDTIVGVSSDEVLLSINAIDGSIIDMSRGY